MITPLLLLLFVQQAPPPAAVTENLSVRKVSNPRGDISARSPLVLAAEKAKAHRAKLAKAAVKIDQETVRTTTGRITIRNPREIPPPPEPSPRETLARQPVASQAPPGRKVETRIQLQERASKLRAEMSKVSEDSESDTPQEGEEDALAQKQRKLQDEIDAINKRLQTSPQ